MKRIDTLEQWTALAGELAEAGYHLSQFQYRATDPHGFHAWFWASGRPQVEIVTFDHGVELAIVEYNPK